MKRGGPLVRILIGAAVGVAVLVFTQFVLPGGQGDGTPGGILFLGVVLGLLNALVAVGIILIFRTARIINFAQGAMGAMGGAFTFNLITLNGWPYWIGFLGGVIIAGATGFVIEIGILRRFFFAPRLAVTVLTIAIAAFVVQGVGYITGLPIFRQDVSASDMGRAIPLPFPDFKFLISGLALEFGFGHLFALGMSIVALAALGYFLGFTKAGVAIRASAENAERAALLGISVKALSSLVWTIAGLLSGLGVILTGSVTRFSSVSGLAPQTLIPALAAAVVAKLRSIPVAIATAVAVTLVQEAVKWSYEDQAQLVNVGLFLVILTGLLIQRKELTRSESSEVSSWKASEEVRPTPKEMLTVPGIRVWRWVFIVVGGLVVAIYPWISSTGQTNFGGFIAINGIVLLSLVVLTGWAGQVSLGQFAFVAIGAVVGGALTAKTGLSFWLAVPLAATLTGAFAVLVGIPALRIKGLFLAITTFAFAYVVQSTLFEEEYFGWLLPERVDRPTLFLLDFEDERSMYYLCVGALALVIFVVTALRKGRVGRLLIGARENEANLQSFGINLVRARLSAFALSGFICGLAGVLLAHHQRAVTVEPYSAQESLNIFLLAVVGGVSSVSGAVLALAYFTLKNLIEGGILSVVVGSLGTLIILSLAPGGLASLIYSLRDAIYRIIAQRRQMVVPSLFADLDPEAIRLRLIPLAEAIPNAGLAALPYHQRYRSMSELYGPDRLARLGRLGKVTDGGGPKDEVDAMGAAAESIGGLGEIGAEAGTKEKVPT